MYNKETITPKIMDAAEMFSQAVIKMCMTSKSRESLHDKRQKNKRDKTELIKEAKMIGCSVDDLE